jgi:sigma-B regulation protein RsbU (phosphoserine phosphatase)
MFATLFFGVLDPQSGELAYINAGHEPLYVISPAGIRKALKPTGPAVGLMPAARFEIEQIHLDQGDLLLGYTDGVTEARSAEDKIFTRERLQSLVGKPGQSAAGLLETIKKDLFAFIDREPRNDDVTMLAVQRMPAT